MTDPASVEAQHPPSHRLEWWRVIAREACVTLPPNARSSLKVDDEVEIDHRLATRERTVELLVQRLDFRREGLVQYL